MVNDSSGVVQPLNLNINDAGAVSWIPGGGIIIKQSSIVASDDLATKIFEACTASNEITVEAWVKPANDALAGPGRIVTISADSTNRNFTMGQDTTGYQIRLRTTVTGNNGYNPPVKAPDTVVTNEMSKLVYSRNAAGEAKFYINGDEVASEAIDGDLSTWDETYRFALGHELDQVERTPGDRSWQGEIFYVAVFSKALTPDELPSLAVEPQGKMAVTWGEMKASQ